MINRMLAVLLILALLSSSAQGQNWEYEEDVLVLNDQNYQNAVNTFEFLMVEVYAPWCGHCKQLAPHYANAANTLKLSDSQVALAKIDGTVNREIAQLLQIQGYPAIFFYKNGRKVEYEGGRTASEIVEYVRKRTELGSVNLKSTSQLEKLVQEKKIVLVMFAQSKDDSEFKVFTQYISKHDDLQYAHSFDKVIAAEAKVYPPALVLYRHGQEKVQYQGQFNYQGIVNFVEKNSYPLIMDFDYRSAQRIFGKQFKTLFLVFNQNIKEQTPKEVTQFNKAVDKLRGQQLLFSRINLKDKVGPTFAEYLQLNTSQSEPSVYIVDTTNSGEIKIYQSMKPITEENVIEFYKKFVQVLKGNSIPWIEIKTLKEQVQDY